MRVGRAKEKWPSRWYGRLGGGIRYLKFPIIISRKRIYAIIDLGASRNYISIKYIVKNKFRT